MSREDESQSSAQDAIRAGLCLLIQDESRRSAAIDEARRKIAEGIEQEERGDMVDGASVMAEWRRLDEEDAHRPLCSPAPWLPA